jgi:transposase InsO family protein
VGYAMAERMTKNLVSQSLLRAIAAKRPAAGLIHHSDRGSQYCAQEYTLLLDRFGMTAVYEPERKLLRQRPDGKLLGRAQERADPPLPV